MKSGLSLIVSKMYLIGMLFSVVFFVAATNSFAENYYVSPSGTASWEQCTNINTPCSAKTGLANAQAGDTVYFRGGTYMAPVTQSSGYTPAFRPSHSGSEGNPIVFKAYPGEIPFIDNSNNEGAAHTVGGFGVNGQSYIIWDGFHSKVVPDSGGLGKGIILDNANHVTVRNCDIEGNLTGNSNNSCIRVDNLDDSVIENNKLYNSRQSGSPSSNSNGLEMYHTNLVICQNNDIWNNDCGIYDKQDGNNNIHRYNHIWNCTYGINLGTVSQATEGIEIYQNVIRSISNGCAIEIQDADTSGCTGFKFYNNTFYDAFWGISLRDATKVTNVEIFNNITHTNGLAVRTYTGAALIIDYNDYYSVTKWNIDSYGGTDYNSLSAWQTGNGFDGNSVTTNPNFVNAGGTSPEDYKRTSYPTNGRGGS
jgi:hypothetical protein